MWNASVLTCVRKVKPDAHFHFPEFLVVLLSPLLSVKVIHNDFPLLFAHEVALMIILCLDLKVLLEDRWLRVKLKHLLKSVLQGLKNVLLWNLNHEFNNKIRNNCYHCRPH